MKRITTNDKDHILASLNLFYTKDNEVWIRGGGPEPDYADCTLVDWIVSAAEKHNLDIFSRDAESLGEEMYDAMQFGSDTMEGVIALLHAAAVQAAIMQSHLAAIEDILGDEYDLDELREMVQAKREERCVVLPCEAGHEISYKSGIGLRCNAVIDEYTPENIFITAKTDIPNAEPLRQTFSLSEIEAALRREQDG